MLYIATAATLPPSHPSDELWRVTHDAKILSPWVGKVKPRPLHKYHIRSSVDILIFIFDILRLGVIYCLL